ncbi:MAG: hypothetical protein J7L15_06065 [Clostridiales bacterium]|nr:hypothetical protein [Clostridiales bacterium]
MYIINTARCGVINEEALIDALEKELHPLYKYPNVIITPHFACYSEDVWRIFRPWRQTKLLEC